MGTKHWKGPIKIQKTGPGTAYDIELHFDTAVQVESVWVDTPTVPSGGGAPVVEHKEQKDASVSGDDTSVLVIKGIEVPSGSTLRLKSLGHKRNPPGFDSGQWTDAQGRVLSKIRKAQVLIK